MDLRLSYENPKLHKREETWNEIIGVLENHKNQPILITIDFNRVLIHNEKYPTPTQLFLAQTFS